MCCDTDVFHRHEVRLNGNNSKEMSFLLLFDQNSPFHWGPSQWHKKTCALTHKRTLQLIDWTGLSADSVRNSMIIVQLYYVFLFFCFLLYTFIFVFLLVSSLLTVCPTQASLPCSIAGGVVYTVLWYRAGQGEPLYTLVQHHNRHHDLL